VEYKVTSGVITNEEVNTCKQGDVMNKSYFSVVLTLICVLGLGISAKAKDAGEVVANVPFDFVAGGKIMPAGKYNISRVSPESHPGLIISSYDGSALVLPISFNGDPAKEAKLSFEHVADKYVLSKVETPVGTYTFTMPQAMTQLGKTKDSGTASSSGTN
jgi:hypothetical protein